MVIEFEKINLKRGLFRIWIVFSIVWIFVNSYNIYLTYDKYYKITSYEFIKDELECAWKLEFGGNLKCNWIESIYPDCSILNKKASTVKKGDFILNQMLGADCGEDEIEISCFGNHVGCLTKKQGISEVLNRDILEKAKINYFLHRKELLLSDINRALAPPFLILILSILIYFFYKYIFLWIIRGFA